MKNGELKTGSIIVRKWTLSDIMENNITLSIDDIARLVNAQWARLKKENKWQFPNDETEDQCKTLFICGYHAALTDMAEVCSGMVEIEKVI